MLNRLFPRICKRMRIFVSYAHEDRDVAERVALGLRKVGHTVFFDRDNLSGGDDYDVMIRDEIKSADRFVFLVSRAALADRRYTLTELRFAREKWPAAQANVLPVIIDKGLDLKALPAYLTAVNIFQPEGNIPSEVANEIEKNSNINGFCKTCFGVGGLASLLAIAAVLLPGFIPTTIVLGQIDAGQFRPLTEPPEDWRTNSAWKKSIPMLVLPVAYNHRTQPGRTARNQDERVDLEIDGRTVPYAWIYNVDLRPDCSGSRWTCATGPAEPEAIEPGKIVSRERMFQPVPGTAFTYGDLIESLKTARSVKVTLYAKVEAMAWSRTVPLNLSAICDVDAAALRERLEQLSAPLGQSPRWFRFECRNPNVSIGAKP